jgi:hypothetical protein
MDFYNDAEEVSKMLWSSIDTIYNKLRLMSDLKE